MHLVVVEGGDSRSLALGIKILRKVLSSTTNAWQSLLERERGGGGEEERGVAEEEAATDTKGLTLGRALCLSKKPFPIWKYQKHIGNNNTYLQTNIYISRFTLTTLKKYYSLRRKLICAVIYYVYYNCSLELRQLIWARRSNK
jgi:hypothetical protein